VIGDILQPTHLIFILVVALLVLGPKRLPEAGRSLGRGLRDFKDALSSDSSDDDREIRDELMTNDVAPAATAQSPPPVETAAPQQAAAPPVETPAPQPAAPQPAAAPPAATAPEATATHTPAPPVHAEPEPEPAPAEPTAVGAPGPAPADHAEA
jgi:TatA/E family protein of Tat protein translocase